MKDLNLLVEKLKLVGAQGTDEGNFASVVKDIALFYQDNFQLEADEVAILMTDKEKAVLFFVYPDYLVNAGMIPVNSPDAFVSHIFKSGRGMIENNFNQQKHLHLFEYINPPGKKKRIIWKLMGAVLKADGEKIGAIELSRKAATAQEAGEDFTPEGLVFLEKSIAHLAPFLQKVTPADFSIKLT